MSEFSVSINNEKTEVLFSGNGTVQIGGTEYNFELIPLHNHDYILKLNNKFYELHGNKIDSERFSLTVNGQLVELTIRTALQEKAARLIERSAVTSSKAEVKAPMPGMVLKIKKTAGDIVTQGESLMILEAMKMENDLKSPVSGKISSIYIKEGAAVDKGSLLFLIEQNTDPVPEVF